jgi:hypothetical protein
MTGATWLWSTPNVMLAKGPGKKAIQPSSSCTCTVRNRSCRAAAVDGCEQRHPGVALVPDMCAYKPRDCVLCLHLGRCSQNWVQCKTFIHAGYLTPPTPQQQCRIFLLTQNVVLRVCLDSAVCESCTTASVVTTYRDGSRRDNHVSPHHCCVPFRHLVAKADGGRPQTSTLQRQQQRQQ